MAVLDLFRATAHVPAEDLLILCDSQYVINAVTKWMPGWKRKGWRKADGKPVLNVDLLKEIDQALVGRKYIFEWVRGHAGHELNEAADERARAAATSYQQGVAVRQGPGFVNGFVNTANGAGPAPQTDSTAAQAAPQASQRTAPPAARQTAPPATRRTAPSGEEELFGRPGLFEEPDLFSELEEEPAGAETLAGASPEAVVESLERELLRPETRADLGRTGVLLHPDFTEIGTSGRIWTRDAMMMALEDDPGGPTELELLGADRLGEKAVLLTYRSHTRRGSALRSSLWVLEGSQWRLRFHQGTPEA
jgi:ribonuclease HI